MKIKARSATYEVEVAPGECLSIPEEVARLFSAGTWIVEVRAKDADSDEVVRDYSALLAAYSGEDDGLYDDVPAR